MTKKQAVITFAAVMAVSWFAIHFFLKAESFGISLGFAAIGSISGGLVGWLLYKIGFTKRK